MQLKFVTAIAAVAVCAGSASAAYITDFDASLTFAGLDLDGIVGSGIGNANFVRATNAAEGIEIGLKGLERFVGELPNTNERYFAQTGVTAGPPAGSTWNYVLAADLGLRTVNDLQINLSIDFDPAFGSAAFTTIDVSAALISQGFGGLSVFGDSQNLDFDFWQTLFLAPPFDPNAPGEYEMVFTVIDPAGNNVIAETFAVVEVVPTPGAVALLGIGGFTAMRRRR